MVNADRIGRNPGLSDARRGPLRYTHYMTFGVRMGPEGAPGRWSKRRRWVKRGAGTPYRKLQSIKFLLTRDRRAVAEFLTAHYPFDFPVRERMQLLAQFTHITNHNRGYHTLAEILTVCDAIFQRADGRALVVVEAGTGGGSSTAKLSLAVRRVNGVLHAFDTFRGIPENDELHHLLDGRQLRFRKGAFKGRLAAVQKRVEEFGAPEVVTLHKGLFADTLPGFSKKCDVILLDVDLASSTRTCAEHLFAQLDPRGALFSQDGHIRETREIFSDEKFWKETVGVAQPGLRALLDGKLLELRPALSTTLNY